jgi:hypothetical protein
MKKPMVRDDMHRFVVDGTTYYIVEGMSSNYCYVYKESHVKYIVLNHTVRRDDEKGDTNVGDHLTFGIVRTADDKQLFKTHRTVYSELQNYEFDRTPYPCNFVISHLPTTISKFATTVRCTSLADAKGTAIDKVYARDDIALVRYLCEVVLTGKITRMRGGRRRVGGASVDYKGVTFLSDTFIDFLSLKMFQPLRSVRPDLDTATIFFDETACLGRDANRYIVIAYDFVDPLRTLFYIDAVLALTACYADKETTAGRGSRLEAAETAAAETFADSCRAGINRIAVRV